MRLSSSPLPLPMVFHCFRIAHSLHIPHHVHLASPSISPLRMPSMVVSTPLLSSHPILPLSASNQYTVLLSLLPIFLLLASPPQVLLIQLLLCPPPLSSLLLSLSLVSILALLSPLVALVATTIRQMVSHYLLPSISTTPMPLYYRYSTSRKTPLSSTLSLHAHHYFPLFLHNALPSLLYHPQ